MIRSAQNTTKRLLVEDSGIAMPISLLVFLFLTFVCMSVFALGEVIRARTELQYKVDNAAYAAALVQADSLSRIAVLNRALVWTYAQTNKRQMDYIVNRWLSESYDAFIVDAGTAENAHKSDGCALHTMPPTRRLLPQERHTSDFKNSDAIYYMVTNENYQTILTALETEGKVGTLQTPLHGLFEPGASGVGEKNIYTMKTMLDGQFAYGYYTELDKEIQQAKGIMQTMYSHLDLIKNNMSSRIRQCVTDLLPENNTVIYGGEKNENSLSPYLENNKEPDTDVFARYEKQVKIDFRGNWTTTPWWIVKGNGREFFPGYLLLKWTGYGVTWACSSGSHTPTSVSQGETKVEAGTTPDVLGGGSWGSSVVSPLLAPLQIKEQYFGTQGAIVVAAKTPIPDLFGNVFGKNKFLNFHVPGNLWAVSAARAGYKNGEIYENSKFLNEDKWNLFVDDWEPMFLPVGRCWKTWDGAKFIGDGADKVLEGVAKELGIDISKSGLNLNEKVNLDMFH